MALRLLEGNLFWVGQYLIGGGGRGGMHRIFNLNLVEEILWENYDIAEWSSKHEIHI